MARAGAAQPRPSHRPSVNDATPRPALPISACMRMNLPRFGCGGTENCRSRALSQGKRGVASEVSLAAPRDPEENRAKEQEVRHA